MSDDPLELARSIRPQAFGDRSANHIAEPVIEPMWSGVRVIAAARDGTAAVLEEGEPFDTLPKLIEHSDTAIKQCAAIDGWLDSMRPSIEKTQPDGMFDVGNRLRNRRL